MKMVIPRIMKYSLWALPRTLVYRDKISGPWMRGYFSNESVKEEYPLKRCHFAAIGSFSVKTVADRHRHAAHNYKH